MPNGEGPQAAQGNEDMPSDASDVGSWHCQAMYTNRERSQLMQNLEKLSRGLILITVCNPKMYCPWSVEVPQSERANA